MKLSEIALRVGALLENCSEDVEITGVARPEEAVSGQIAYVLSPENLPAARMTRASALIAPEAFNGFSVPILRTGTPNLVLARVLELFYIPPQYEEGVHPTAVIHASAKIGPRASIGAYVVIDRDAEIGAEAVILPHVVIYRGARIGKNFFAHAHAVVREYCRLGDNVILQNGAVVGADAFGFAVDHHGGHFRWRKMANSGTVVLGDCVEIQTNACIERGVAGETRIGNDVKVGDLAAIGHGTSINDHSLLLGQVGVASETKLGEHVILLGQAGVAPYCRIGDGAKVTVQSGVMQDVGEGQIVSGSPAIEHTRWRRSVALFKRLPELAHQLHGPSLRAAARKKRTALPPKGEGAYGSYAGAGSQARKNSGTIEEQNLPNTVKNRVPRHT